MNINIDNILEDCIETAKFAGAYLNEHFGKAVRAEKMEDLPEGVDAPTFNVVTDVDLNLQREVAKKLLEKYPSFEFFGEESPEKVFDPIKDKGIIEKINTNKSKYQFVVDPLDGTGRYADGDARHGFFVGLLEDNNFILSVAYNPKQDSLTYAVKGKGCFRNNKPFVFNSTVEDHMIINSKAAKKEELKKELRSDGLFLMRPKHTGTMYDMLFSQYAPSMVSLKTNTHDHPLSLAVEEAGGSVLVYDGDKFVKGHEFNWRTKESKKDANIPAYIAANSEKNAEKLANIIERHI